MKKRICVIGNSHVAALKKGWDEIAGDYPDIEVTMFAAPGGHIGKSTFQDGSIVATSDLTRSFFLRSGGAETIALDSIDDFIVVGSAIDIERFMDLMLAATPMPYFSQEALGRADKPDRRTGRPARAKREGGRRSILARIQHLFRRDRNSGEKKSGNPRRGRRFIRQNAPSRPAQLVSLAVFSELVRSYFAGTNAAKLIEGALRQANLRLFYVPSPLPAHAIVGTEKGETVSRFLQRHRPEDGARLYWNLLEDFVRGRAVLVRQPMETMENPVLTKDEYAKGSISLAADPSKRSNMDMRHMNLAYGQLMMKEIIAATLAESHGSGRT